MISEMKAPARRSYGRIPNLLELKDLIATQLDSFNWFKTEGLRELFDEINPITDYTGKNFELRFLDFEFGPPKFSVEECRNRDQTYAAPLRIRTRLTIKETGEIKESDVYMGDFAMMTDEGTFIVNGTERVVVSQLVRSPGVYFTATEDPATGRRLFGAKLIPNRGAWLEIETSAKDVITVKIDRKRKVPVTVLLKALELPQLKGTDSDREAQRRAFLELFGDVDDNPEHRYIEATFERDPTTRTDDALLDLYRRVRPGDPPSIDNARSLLNSLFFNPRRFDLGRVGRYKVDKRLGRDPEDIQERVRDRNLRILEKGDFIAILRKLIELNNAPRDRQVGDDIDHLGNRRVKPVGELLQNQFRMGLIRMERIIKERMTISDPATVTAASLINARPVVAAIKEFFGSSQLSQFMDQVNPLAELTHKRRLSALGPGGLSRERAGFDVRDVHHSHYGRICPIETPEGPNIGLIGSMAVYARVDQFGFLETPYRKVKDGVVTDEIVWMTADQDHRYYIAPANIPLDEDGRIRDEYVQVRYEDGYPTVHRAQVQYMDVAPVQLVSIATALIPFIENNEATRALMGANMQRQAVPTLRPQAPLVKTGMERRAALDSGAVVRARRSGVVTRVTSEQIDITTPDGRVDSYYLLNMLRSNNSTCITQRPIVRKGQHVRQGQVLTDGPCIENGELALGQNVLVAFMPWGGFNFEDAILISERLVKDDVYTSIHIEEFDTEARDTKLGPEEITRDIPNVGEDTLSDLDENGIIRVGAEVRPDDILVGKVAPKGQGELTAEERLIIAIFGKKAEETRDVSLRVPHGNGGRVIDVKVFSRYKYQGARDGRVYNFCKRPEPGMRDSQDGELLRLPQDELPVGVNMLVRVYVAQKRKVMEGDKMAGRHGNKGVISKILPVEDMPFLPDGTPVDIVLNPLGVPSRMNIGQILETHLGYVAHHLNCSFVNPSFEGMTESEIIEQMEILGAKFWRERLQKYLNSELRLYVSLDSVEPFNEFAKVYREQYPLPADATLQNGQATPEQAEHARTLYEAYIRRLLEPVREALMERSAEDLNRLSQLLAAAVTNTASHEEVVEAIVQKIEENCRARVGFDPHTGKSWVRDGLTGETFDMPVTVGVIYMLKLAHLVDDKI